MGCIYMARNEMNGKCYVGKTEKSLDYRKYSHLWGALHESNSYFCKAIRKYGSSAFVWSILFEVEDKYLNRWEKYYIKRLGAKVPNGYNLTDGGDGIPNPSPAIRAKIGDANRGRIVPDKVRAVHRENSKRMWRDPRFRLRMYLSQIGKINSPETRIKIGNALRGKPSGMLGKHQSAETRNRHRECSIRLWQDPVYREKQLRALNRGWLKRRIKNGITSTET